ncbi:ubiquitin-specific protease ubp15 [Coemansia sp. RSA 2049]|nr:ubiquitin-specific protease ubp15 [Coemansia sp. RSA 2049]
MDYNSEVERDALQPPAHDAAIRDTSELSSDAPRVSPPSRTADFSGRIVPPVPPVVAQHQQTIPTVLDEEEYMAKQIVVPHNLEEEGHGWFHWEIEDWTQLQDRAISKTFTVAGRDWDILLFPRGNQSGEIVSMYIEHKPKEDDGSDWHVCAMFELTMSNVDKPEVFKSNPSRHRFTQEESDWGFTRFIDIRTLVTPPDDELPSLVENGRVRISAFVRVIKDPLGVLWHNFYNYNSRKHTGFVGLKNQGATCYMNSLLQSLYFTNDFRNAVYKIPTENDDPKKSVALALQRVFYDLQVSSEPVDTTALTKSFGWDSYESFMQHDVQEFNRVLQDNLETKMKGTIVDGAIAKLFEGKMKSYVRCVNVEYESSRVENYYDIALNVKGCATLRDSFANYCEVEMLDGENKYQAEGHGLQDARKGVIFESFPPVLQLQLKRFEYDFTRDAMVKINDRHEFPPTIDLEEFLSDDADRSMSWKYSLHGVLVHSGDLHGGHYFGLLRPTMEDKWFRFDDDRVVPVFPEEVFEEYYGGELTQMNAHGGPVRMRQNSKRFTNAYMLVYIRQALSDEVMCGGDAPVPGHLIKRIQQDKDAEERRIRERQELANMVRVTVVGKDQFSKHQGFDLCQFNQRQAKDNQLFSELMPRNATLGSFKKFYAERFGMRPTDFRLWTMVPRVNKTVRCDMPLVGDSNEMTLAQLKENRGHKWADLRLFCEESSENSPEAFHAEKLKPGIHLIHIKYYLPEEGRIVGLGNLYIQADQRVGDIMPDLRRMAGLPADAALTLYEEVKPSLIEEMNTEYTFHRAEIQSGDIICFQQQTQSTGAAADNELDTVAKFFDDIENRVSVEFVERPTRGDGDDFGGVAKKGTKTAGNVGDSPNGGSNDTSNSGGGENGDSGNDNDSVYVTVASTKTPYDQIAQRLAKAIGERDPLRLRFYVVGSNGQMRQPVRRLASTTLGDMLPSINYAPPPINADGLKEYVVMYERLEVDIMQIEKLRNIRVTYIGKKSMKDEHAVEVLVPKIGTTQTLIEAVYAKVESALRKTQDGDGNVVRPFALRFYTVAGHRLRQMVNGSESIEEMGSQRVGEVVAEYVSSDDQQPQQQQPMAVVTPKGDESRMDTDEEDTKASNVMGVDVEVFHFYRDLTHTHSVPFLFRIFAGEPWADTWARLGRRLGLGEKELKSMGVVVGPQGVVDVRACQVVQEGSLGIDSNNHSGNGKPGSVTSPTATPPLTATAAADTESGAADPAGDDTQHLQSQSQSQVDAGGAEAVSPVIAGAPADAEGLCVWDIIQRMVSAQPILEETGGRPRITPGFIALNHIDRSSRYRGAQHQERAIRILN